MSLKSRLRSKGMWLNAEEALVIERAIYRAHINVTEPGAEVIKRFLIRCQELERPKTTEGPDRIHVG